MELGAGLVAQQVAAAAARGQGRPPRSASGCGWSRARGRCRRRRSRSDAPSSWPRKSREGVDHHVDSRDGGRGLHGDRARAARAAAARDAVAVALHDADRVDRDAGAVGQEPGIDRLVPLPVRLGADEKRAPCRRRRTRSARLRTDRRGSPRYSSTGPSPRSLPARRRFRRGGRQSRPHRPRPGAREHAGEIAHVDVSRPWRCHRGSGG